MTVRELITSSLRLIGQLGPGRGGGASEMADALWILNDMLDEWDTQRLTVFRIARDTYTLTASQQTYTLGPGGDFDAPRPVRIAGAGISITDQTDPIELPVDVKGYRAWKSIILKNTESSWPNILYPEGSVPQMTLHLWPVPQRTYDLVLYTWTALTKFDQLTEEVIFPPGYAAAIRYNLALHLAPEWGRDPRPDVIAEANRKMMWLKTLNLPDMTLGVDPALVGSVGEGKSTRYISEVDAEGPFAPGFGGPFV